MRYYLLVTISMLFFVGAASAGWFGSNDSESVATLKKDALKTLESAKTVGKEKIEEAKTKAKDSEKKARRAAKDASDKAEKIRDKAKEEGKGLIGDVKSRLNRLFNAIHEEDKE